jgi:hypothetical protein
VFSVALNFVGVQVRWLMDAVHRSLDTGLPVISTLPLTQIETQWLVMKLEGPYLSPFGVEKQTALTAALQKMLLQKTNIFLLNVTQVSSLMATKKVFLTVGYCIELGLNITCNLQLGLMVEENQNDQMRKEQFS